MKALLAAALAATLAACASPFPLSLDKQPQAVAQTPGNGQIIFYRPCKSMGFARGGVYIMRDQARIGGLNCSTYLIFPAQPGTYRFAAALVMNFSPNEYLDVTVEPGHDYYIKADVDWKLLTVRPYLQVSNAAEAQPALQDSTRVALKSD